MDNMESCALIPRVTYIHIAQNTVGCNLYRLDNILELTLVKETCEYQNIYQSQHIKAKLCVYRIRTFLMVKAVYFKVYHNCIDLNIKKKTCILNFL